MADHPVDPDAFLLQQDIQPGFQRSKGGEQMDAHEVRQIKVVLRIPHE